MSGMQAALLIRREKQRLRGGKAVNFRDLPSNLATRLIPPLPRYPPRSYVYGVSIKSFQYAVSSTVIFDSYWHQRVTAASIADYLCINFVHLFLKQEICIVVYT